MKKLNFSAIVLVTVSLAFLVSCVAKEYQVTENYYETEYRTEYKTESYAATERVVTTIDGVDYPNRQYYWWDTDYGIWNPSYRFEGIWYFAYELRKYSKSRVDVGLSDKVGSIVQKDIWGRVVSGGDTIMVLAYDVTNTGHIPQFSSWNPPAGYEYNDNSGSTAHDKWSDWVNSQLASAHFLKGGYYKGKDVFQCDTTGTTKLAIIIAGSAPPVFPISGVTLFWSDEVAENKMVTKERMVPYQVPYRVEKQRTVVQTRKVPIWGAVFSK